VKLQHFDIEFRRPAGATNVLCKKHPVWALSAKVGMLYPFYRNIAEPSDFPMFCISKFQTLVGLHPAVFQTWKAMALSLHTIQDYVYCLQ
jgi:hypothetical protein